MRFLQFFILSLSWRLNEQLAKQSFEKNFSQQSVTRVVFINTEEGHNKVISLVNYTYPSHPWNLEFFKSSPWCFPVSAQIVWFSGSGYLYSPSAAGDQRISQQTSSWEQTLYASLRAHLALQHGDKFFWILWKPIGKCWLSFLMNT